MYVYIYMYTCIYTYTYPIACSELLGFKLTQDQAKRTANEDLRRQASPDCGRNRKLYVSVYMYVCIYICIYRYIDICRSGWLETWTRYVNTHTHTHTHTYIYIYIYMCVCIYIYVYIHIYIYTYTHAIACSDLLGLGLDRAKRTASEDPRRQASPVIKGALQLLSNRSK